MNAIRCFGKLDETTLCIRRRRRDAIGVAVANASAQDIGAGATSRQRIEQPIVYIQNHGGRLRRLQRGLVGLNAGKLGAHMVNPRLIIEVGILREGA